MKRIYKHPWLIVIVTAAITVFFCFQLPKAELDNNNLRFVPPDDPALETSQWIDKMFGSSFFILVGLQRPYGTIFEREFLDCIRNYTSIIEEIPIVRSVTSVINADYITSSGDAIIVEKLMDSDFSGTPQEITEFKRRLLSWNMYEKALFSDDFTATQILVPLTISADEAASKEITGQFLQIRDTAREIFDGKAAVYVTGMPIIIATVNEAMNADLKLLIPVVILVVLLILFFSFRAFTPVVLPLLTVLISVIWSVGAMPLFGIKLSVISTVLPVILVAVGSAYGIHVVTHYIAGRGKNEMNFEEYRDFVLEVVMKIRKPVFLAALTTFAGFLSFCFTKVAPCREFGYFASFGVASAFTVAIFLIPAILIIRGPRTIASHTKKADRIEEKNTGNSGMNAFLAENLVIIVQRKKTVLLFAAVIIAFSAYGLSKLIIDNVMVEYFRPDTDIYRSDEFIRKQFGGSKLVSVVAHAGSPEIILHPSTLCAMDGLSVFLQQKIPLYGKVMGFTDLVKRINQVFNANEEPDGLRVTAAQNVSGTGFDNDFGFGFDSFGFDSITSPAIEENTGMSRDSGTDSERFYTQKDIVELFDRAASASRNMNANDLVREIKRQINYEGVSYYEIPSDPARYGKKTGEELQRLIANYLVLLSGNISDYANDPLEPTAIKSTVQLRTLGMEDSHAIFHEIERYVKENFPSDVQVTIGGTTMVESSLNDLVVQSQIISMLFSIICVFIIITVSNKSLAAGFAGITPLSISILLNFAVMGFTGIKLNLGTSMVAAVSVGVGIDYTIHCLEAFKREYTASLGKGDFLRRVFFSSGKAIIINAVSVGAGFAVLMLSRFVMLGDLGLLIAFTMFSSAFVSLTVLPALLLVFKPKFIYKEK